MKVRSLSFFLFFALAMGSLAAQEAAKSVRGLITAVEEKNIVVQDSSGKNWRFEITGDLDVPLNHIKEHQQHKWPVTVYFQDENGKKKTLRITD